MCDLLVLDDDPLVRMTLIEALGDSGLEVVGVADECEALAVLRLEHPLQAFVTDLDLGTRRNGFVVAAVARLMFPQLPIIYITGRPDSLIGRTLGTHETVLHKPFRTSELLAAVRTAIDGSLVH